MGSRQLGGVLQLAGDRTAGFTHISEFEGLPEGEATRARAGTPPAHTLESQMDEKTNTDHGQNPARDPSSLNILTHTTLILNGHTKK